MATSVRTWEDLPAGDWLETDESGTHWYLDHEGNHWYSDENAGIIFTKRMGTTRLKHWRRTNLKTS